MRALSELAGVILAGFAAFFGGILFLAGLVLLWLCGIASALFLMIAAFAGVMYAFTGSHHAAVIALGYLGYAAVPFVVTFVLAYYHGKLGDARQQRQALHRIRGIRPAEDAGFAPDAGRR